LIENTYKSFIYCCYINSIKRKFWNWYTNNPTTKYETLYSYVCNHSVK